MARAIDADVRAIADIDPCIPVAPFITAAHLLTERVKACASNRGITLSEDELTQIETWLAAYYYSARDERSRVTSKSTLSASASFADTTAKAHLDMAMSLDPSGCLDALINNKRARMTWIGKRSKCSTSRRGCC